MSQVSEVDWSKPIEAYHTDGQVWSVTLTPWEDDKGLHDGPDDTGDWYTTWPFQKGPAIWKPYGTPWMKMQPGWRIRNVAQPAAAAPTAPIPSEVGPVESFLVPKLTEAQAREWVTTNAPGAKADGLLAFLAEHSALLPEPVDALEDVIAKAMANGNEVSAFEIAQAIRVSGLTA